MAQDQELRRQGEAVARDRGVDAGGIGLEQCQRGRVEAGRRALGAAGKPERADEPVVRQSRCAQHLGQSALARQPVELHLPQPVLAMEEAQRQVGVGLALRCDVWDRTGIAHDGDGCMQARQPGLPRQLGQRGAGQPDRTASDEQGDGREGQRKSGQPAAH